MIPLLRAANLHVTLGSREVLRGASLDVAAGELVALLGPNGCGKTTLLRALAGLVPFHGERWIDGLASATRGGALARHVAYLPQTPTLLEGLRVRELLLMGRLPYRGWLSLESRSDAEVVAEIAGRLELSDLLDRRIETLSGGQRQRAFIGRCLAQRPKLMLLDEPATYLDLRHQVELHRLLRSLSRQAGVAVVMASHDFNLAAMHCDRLVLMDEGAIVANGPAGEVLRDDLVQRVYGVAVRRLDVDGVPLIVPIE